MRIAFFFERKFIMLINGQQEMRLQQKLIVRSSPNAQHVSYAPGQSCSGAFHQTRKWQ